MIRVDVVELVVGTVREGTDNAETPIREVQFGGQLVWVECLELSSKH